MTQQFTANEVRAYTHKVGDGIPMLSDMLRAFADMLEAREKAVPFGYAYRYRDGIRFDTGGREINGSKPTATIPLYTHTPTHLAPSDAERLAEALQPFANLLQPHHASIPDDRPIYGINKAEITAGDLRRANEALAAHPAQAQPPAARVTHAMVQHAQDCLHDKGKDIGYYHMRAALEAALAAQENLNG